MATVTMGSTSQVILTAVPFSKALAEADVATIQQSILDDKVNGTPVYPGAFTKEGLLWVPNRGYLRVLDGDYIAVDTKGWPILVSALSAGTAASWVHT